MKDEFEEKKNVEENSASREEALPLRIRAEYKMALRLLLDD